MAAPTTCPICSGRLVLRYPGTTRAPDAEALSPTNHRPGEYGDLYACTACGTIQQPSLPSGPELAALYRQMHDEAYLAEEAGRRRTARRMLDLIDQHAAPGRLLDVGCGPGLLLDEARARGHEVEGVELSVAAAAHARDELGLLVHEVAIEEFDGEEGGYGAIVLADVLEHLADPVAALRRCNELLRPGGLLCVVTPDPSSRMARLAGARWWGFLPAHTFLLPRATLRDVLAAEGFAVSQEVPLVRSFSARYWVAGLAERGGGLGTAIGAIAKAAPRRTTLSLSLGDERIVLGHKRSRRFRPRAVERAEPVAVRES
ncbi:MAG: class I SAM-dependent methyltransferase [Actinobacteria bacterium]|nr:MAG: class I SAM-dependent methyltransferase [Actinomycetota bacterium]